MNPPNRNSGYGDDSEDTKERIELIKSTSHLSLAFGAWAIVVVIVGALGMYMLKRIMDGQDVMEGVDARQSSDIRALEAELSYMKLRGGVPISIEADQRITKLEAKVETNEHRIERLEGKR